MSFSKLKRVTGVLLAVGLVGNSSVDPALNNNDR